MTIYHPVNEYPYRDPEPEPEPKAPLGEAGARLRALVAQWRKLSALKYMSRGSDEDVLVWRSVGDSLIECADELEALLSAPVVSPPEFTEVRKLHTAFNVCIRREGGIAPACDGPDCVICRDIAREFSGPVVTQEGEEPCP